MGAGGHVSANDLKRLLDKGAPLTDSLKTIAQTAKNFPKAVQDVAEAAGFSVVRNYVGHAIGTEMHEEPQVPNYWPGTPGPRIKVGNVFAIEPMVNAGGPETVELAAGWSVVPADGRRSAHFEHTIAVTDDGPEVFTIP